MLLQCDTKNIKVLLKPATAFTTGGGDGVLVTSLRGGQIPLKNIFLEKLIPSPNCR